jgi:hypothetical protein
MEHSPLGADISAASQEISRILWNPKAHYTVHNSQALIPLQCQMNSIYAVPPYFFKIHFNIIPIYA